MDLNKDGKPQRNSVIKDEIYHTVDVIVCHGNVIRFWLLRALQLNPSAWLHMGLAHASISRLSVGNDGWVGLKSVGETAFMPIAKVSY
jgi:serine/threonine-protein phosphatase PGAM5